MAWNAYSLSAAGGWTCPVLIGVFSNTAFDLVLFSIQDLKIAPKIFSARILFPFRQLGCVGSALKVSFFHFPFLHIIDHYLTANLIFLRKADHNHNADHHHPRLSAMARWNPHNHHHNHYCSYKIESSNPTIHFENKHLRHLWTGIVRIGHGGAFRYEGAGPALLLVLPWHDNHHWHCPQHLPKNDEDDIHHHNPPPLHPTWPLSTCKDCSHPHRLVLKRLEERCLSLRWLLAIFTIVITVTINWPSLSALTFSLFMYVCIIV